MVFFWYGEKCMGNSGADKCFTAMMSNESFDIHADSWPRYIETMPTPFGTPQGYLYN